MRRLLVVIAALVTALALAAPAGASVTQESIFQDDNQVLADPVGTLQTLRDLGVQRVRVNVTWDAIAPAPNSRRRPKKFNATNPGAYPASGWAPYDRVVEAAASDGISLDFTLDGPAPLWATASGAPRGTTGYFLADWEPSAKEFGYFVQAVGTRYGGSYKPHGAAGALPRVSFWSIWNEPNYGGSLGPQGVPGNLTVPDSPRIYRSLLGAAWNALRATGHRTPKDTVLIGELAPRGSAGNGWGDYGGVRPLIFVQSLYCVDSGFRELRGSIAAAEGCPTSTAGSRRFRGQNPALFGASGFSDHPYEQASAPNLPTYLCAGKLCTGRSDPDYADLPEVPRLERALDRVNAAYRSRAHLPVWSTEYGFRTAPPDPHEGVSPDTAADYMNWAEYLSYKQPRLYSYSQYKLRDFPPPAYFDTGLENPDGSAKPGFDAYRMPLYLPTTSMTAGHTVEVWGCVRPSAYAKHDTGQAQSVEIEFQGGRGPSSTGAWQVLDTVPITNSKGYFDLKLAFPSSGAVRTAWTYPAGDPRLSSGTVYSRTVTVTVK